MFIFIRGRAGAANGGKVTQQRRGVAYYQQAERKKPKILKNFSELRVRFLHADPPRYRLLKREGKASHDVQSSHRLWRVVGHGQRHGLDKLFAASGCATRRDQRQASLL